MATPMRVRHPAHHQFIREEPAESLPSYWQATLTNVIWFVSGVILILLAFRFLLTLLGANSGNGFADFIYFTSHPFVAPFFGLFSYQQQFGAAHFEAYTLVAMAVYWVVAWLLTSLVNLNRPTYPLE